MQIVIHVPPLNLISEVIISLHKEAHTLILSRVYDHHLPPQRFCIVQQSLNLRVPVLSDEFCCLRLHTYGEAQTDHAQ